MVDRILLERILGDVRYNVGLLRDARDIDWLRYLQDPRSRRFVERTLQILVEACIDAAQHIISDEGLREPSSYRDAFVVLAENRILNGRHLPIFEEMAAFRNLIVHYYERIDDEIVFGVFKNHLSDFDLFIEEIVRYLKESNPHPE